MLFKRTTVKFCCYDSHQIYRDKKLSEHNGENIVQADSTLCMRQIETEEL